MDPGKLHLISTRMRHFQAVVQFGSIRAAALALNVAPSAVSRTIQSLEEALGQPLFERVRQRLKLTSAGEILIYHNRTSVAELERACAIINNLAGLRTGKIRIAAVESVTRGLLPSVLAEFWRRMPDFSVEVRTVSSAEALRLVADGEVDFGLAFDNRLPRGTQRLASANLSFGILVWPGHRLAHSSDVRLRELAGEKMILSDSTLSLNASIDAALSEHKVELIPRAMTNSIDLMARCVTAGLAVALQTRIGVESELSRGELCFVTVRDGALRPRRLILAARNKPTPADASSALATALGEAIAQLDGR